MRPDNSFLFRNKVDDYLKWDRPLFNQTVNITNIFPVGTMGCCQSYSYGGGFGFDGGCCQPRGFWGNFKASLGRTLGFMAPFMLMGGLRSIATGGNFWGGMFGGNLFGGASRTSNTGSTPNSNSASNTSTTPSVSNTSNNNNGSGKISNDTLKAELNALKTKKPLTQEDIDALRKKIEQAKDNKTITDAEAKKLLNDLDKLKPTNAADNNTTGNDDTFNKLLNDVDTYNRKPTAEGKQKLIAKIDDAVSKNQITQKQADELKAKMKDVPSESDISTGKKANAQELANKLNNIEGVKGVVGITVTDDGKVKIDKILFATNSTTLSVAQKTALTKINTALSNTNCKVKITGSSSKRAHIGKTHEQSKQANHDLARGRLSSAHNLFTNIKNDNLTLKILNEQGTLENADDMQNVEIEIELT